MRLGSRDINCVLTKLARELAGKIVTLGLFCTHLTTVKSVSHAKLLGRYSSRMKKTIAVTSYKHCIWSFAES